MSGEHRDDLVMQSLLLDEIGQSVIGMDGDWRITYWNRASECLYGFRPDRVLGAKITDLGIVGGAEVRGGGSTDMETLGVADSLRLDGVAERVEPVIQLAELRRLGVRLAQGYLGSRPLPAERIAAWL